MGQGIGAVMDGEKSWGIRFEHDTVNDIVFVHPSGDIQSAEDAADFHRVCTAYYEPFGRKLDVIINLDQLTVQRGVDLNRASRKDLLERFIDHVVLVSYNVVTVADIAHRVANDGFNYNMAPDVRSAVKLIKNLRAETNVAAAVEAS